MSSYQCPKCQFSSRTPLPLQSPVSNKADSLLTQSYASRGLCTPPSQSRKSSPLPELTQNYKIEQYVLRLYVPVNNQLLMNVINPLNDLLYDSTHFRLLHSSVLSQHFQQLPTSTVFDQQVHIFFVLEVTVKWCDIPMSQIKLNAQFSRNLPFVFLVTNLLLLHHFHPAKKTCLFMLDQHHFAKLTLPELFAHNKIIFLKIN